MQATTLLTSLDKQAGSAKSAKSTTSSDAGNNFNQMLNKEISSVKKPDSDVNRNVAKPATAPKPNNNAGATPNNSSSNVNNNANNNADKQNTADNAPGTPVKNSSPADETDNSSKVSKDDEKNTAPVEDLSAQILALVGNLAPAPVTADASKATVISTDVAATDALAAADASVLAASNAATGTTDTTALAGDSKYAETADKLAAAIADAKTAAADIKANSKNQVAGEAGVSAADINAIAAQLMAGKATAGTKATDKTVTNTTVSNAIDNKLAGSNTTLVATPALTPAPKDTTVKTDGAALTDASKTEVTTSDLALGSKASDKAASATTAIAADTAKSFASDVAQAREVIADKLAEIKPAESSKETPQVIAPAPIATQAVSNSQANAATAMAIDHISPRVGNPGWDKAVSQKVVWMVGEAMQSAELTLNPPDLGPLQVVLKVSNDQANASFTAAQPEVREALEAALPRLRQMLSDAGVQLTGFSVNSQAAGAGQGQNFAQQQARNTGTSRLGNDIGDNTTVAATSSQPKVRVSNGVVDTFA
ncbi:flagellar hook-length control protein FliK [Undibacterium sp. CY18W]|uniref:Flagellar hook-length control protein FliK n=1 Tax=Undibacterium hunanense TaxID=2762292 RepID=A0ABR6ZN87_9BURK|nr:flagellar hook-length control protein FliK [Undibacterium hunanense]MBC3917360.1 flagellar hook-length control protein FliK [Undibacterium hunanense]